MKTLREDDLYLSVKNLLQSLDMLVMGEVGRCDILAKSDSMLIAVELKLGYSIRLLEQAVDRQRIADLVYVGLPARALSSRRSRRRTQEYLIQRLGVGLILVHDAEYAVFAFHPRSHIPRIHRKKREELVHEIQSRILDANSGGSTRRALFTAYRQDAMHLAVLLARSGPCSPRELRESSGCDRAYNILRDNHYGWFTRVSRGVYDLSDRGRTEPDELFPEVMTSLRER